MINVKDFNVNGVNIKYCVYISGLCNIRPIQPNMEFQDLKTKLSLLKINSS